MKFKEIKPGMVIRCQKEEDARALVEYLKEQGYDVPTLVAHKYYCISDDMCVTWTDTFPARRESKTITEFPDLIEPDSPINSDIDSPMTEIEVMKWLHAYKHNSDDMSLSEIFDVTTLDALFCWYDVDEIINKITAYEAAKKEKPVEVEWVDICRIIQIQDNGFKKCVYEEVLPDNYGCVDYQNAENILKKYISEHEGRYIAVNEGICRVKEGES